MPAAIEGLELAEACLYCDAPLWLWSGVKAGVVVICERDHQYLIPIKTPLNDRS